MIDLEYPTLDDLNLSVRALCQHYINPNPVVKNAVESL